MAKFLDDAGVGELWKKVKGPVEQAQAAADGLKVWEAYDASKTYHPLNKVSYEGSSYVCQREATGVYPGAPKSTFPELTKLLESAWKVYGDKTDLTALDWLTEIEMVNGAPYWFRADSDGTPFADVAGFRVALGKAILALKNVNIDASTIGAVTWLTAQNLLCGHTYRPSAGLAQGDFWWANGGHRPDPIDVDAAMAKILVEASKLNQDYIGETTDESTLAAVLGKYMSDLKLRASAAPESEYGKEQQAELQAKLRLMVAEALVEIWDNDDPTYADADKYYVEMSLREVQYYLLNGTLASEESEQIPDYPWLPVYTKPDLAIDNGTWLLIASHGEAGSAGRSAYQQAVDGGYKGTEAEFNAALAALKDGPFLPTKGGQMMGQIWGDSSSPESNAGLSLISVGGDGQGYAEIGADGSRAYLGVATANDGRGFSVVLNMDTGEIKTETPDPKAEPNIANKRYVDEKASTLAPKDHTHTAEQVGALPADGGTLRGTLTADVTGWPKDKATGMDLYSSFGCGGLLASEGQIGLSILPFSGEDGNLFEVLMNGPDGKFVTTTPMPETDYNIANKKYVDSKTPVFTGKTVPTTAWASNTTYSAQGYGFRAAVACAGVTASHRPDVAFGAADAVSGNFAPVADSYDGGVYIYCKTKPTATVTIPSIVCIKGV